MVGAGFGDHEEANGTGGLGAPGPGSEEVPFAVTEPAAPGSSAPAHIGGPARTPVGLVPKVPVSVEAGGLGWTLAKQTWVRSMVGVVALFGGFLVLLGLSDAVSLSSLMPFGSDDETELIGSEAVAAGPNTDTASEAGEVSSSGVGGANVLQPLNADEDDETAESSSTTSASSTTSSTSVTSSTTSSTASSTTTTQPPTTTSVVETTTTTEASSSTSETKPTTETTSDTDPNTSSSQPSSSTTDASTTTSSSTTSSTVSSSTTEPVEPPVILRFRSRLTFLLCGEPGEWPFEVAWDTENADSVKLLLGDESSRALPSSGTARFCAVPGSEVRLIAEGPGGKAEASTIL